MSTTKADPLISKLPSDLPIELWKAASGALILMEDRATSMDTAVISMARKYHVAQQSITDAVRAAMGDEMADADEAASVFGELSKSLADD